MVAAAVQARHEKQCNECNNADKQAEAIKKLAEMNANIPKRAVMLEKASDDVSFLPRLPSILWQEIAEYEGGVESSLLGIANSHYSYEKDHCCSIS